MPSTALPTLSEVRAFTGDYLTSAAHHWSESAQRWADAYDRVMRDVSRPAGTEWLGDAAEAAALRVGTDRRKVVPAADGLTAAAATARRAADDLHAAKAKLLGTVRAAEAAGFTVGDDFSLTSLESTTSLKALAARESQLRSFGTAIRSDVLALVKADEHAATQIAEAATSLRSVTSYGDDQAASDRGAIQAVDFNGTPLPEKPPNPPAIPPPEGWSPDPLMRAAQKIAYGHMSDPAKGHMGDFPGMTTAQVADLIYQKMQRAMTDPSGMTIGVSKSDGVPVIYDPKDNVLIVRDSRPNAPDGGTAFKPGNPEKVINKFGSYVSIFTPDQLADGPTMEAPHSKTPGGSTGVTQPVPGEAPTGGAGGAGADLGSVKDWGTYVPPEDLAKQDGALGILGRILLGHAPPNPNDPDDWA